MKGIIKDSLILFAITIISGLLLGWVYDITKEPIANQQLITKQNACKAVFENADQFGEVVYSEGDSRLAFEGGDVKEVMTAMDSTHNVLGYVISVVDHEGYGGDIAFLVGIQNDGTVNGISFLTINETAGLGMKAKNPEFKDQFNGKLVDKFVYTKSGAVADNEIDAISAATFTTKAVTNGVNGALDFFYANLKESTEVTGGAQ